MQSTSQQPAFDLQIYPCTYVPQLKCYITANPAASIKIQSNNIPLRELLHYDKANQYRQQRGVFGKLRYIFSQQMLYLTMVSQYGEYEQMHNEGKDMRGGGKEMRGGEKDRRKEFGEMRERDIMRIYQLIDEVGYDRFQFVQFYLRIRKKSKIIRRRSERIQEHNYGEHAMYEIFKNVGDYKLSVHAQTILLVVKHQPINTIIQARNSLPVQIYLKVQILGNMDGVVLSAQSSFPISQPQHS